MTAVTVTSSRIPGWVGFKVVDAKLILDQARVIKSPEELKCMKAAIDVAEIGVS